MEKLRYSVEIDSTEELTAEVDSTPEMGEFFNTTFPAALKRVKELCEN